MSEEEALREFYRDFVRLLAHGLKNRLTPAVTGSFMLQDDHLPVENFPKINQMVVDSLEKTLKLINGVERFEPLTPKHAEELEFRRWLAGRAQAKGLDAKLEGEVERLLIDPGLWGPIVDELFENCVEHGNGRAEVVWCLQDDGRLRLQVRDSGPGLGALCPNRALEATRSGENSPGVGLGLSRAQLAAMLLGGNLDLRLVDGGGVCVTVTAPLSRQVSRAS